MEQIELSGFELESRRRALGLSQQALGKMLDRQNPIKENAINKWETGKYPAPPHIQTKLENLENEHEELIGQILQTINPTNHPQNEPTTKTWDDWNPAWPTQFQQTALALASRTLRDENITLKWNKPTNDY